MSANVAVGSFHVKTSLPFAVEGAQQSTSSRRLSRQAGRFLETRLELLAQLRLCKKSHRPSARPLIHQAPIAWGFGHALTFASFDAARTDSLLTRAVTQALLAPRLQPVQPSFHASTRRHRHACLCASNLRLIYIDFY